MDLGSISLEPIPWILSGLRLVHFAGIILGIGAATLLDLVIFRFVLTKRIEKNHISIIIFSSHVIITGLVLLWISGIGFFVYYWLYDPPKIDNPKLVAKVIIVGMLTLNAFLVHFFVLPQVTTQIGQRLLDGLSKSRCFFLIFIGTVSAISWYVPLILGIVPQFNNTIPTGIILASYAALVLSVNVVAGIVVIILPHQRRRKHGVRDF
jgi:hypothetical protein